MNHKSLPLVMILVLSLAIQFAPAQTDCIGAAGTSSRSCLVMIAERYFEALAAHDPSKAPLAATFRFTERPLKETGPIAPVAPVNITTTNKNQRSLTVDGGLWKTITEGPTTFKIYVPDPVSQEIGGIAMIRSENQPTALAFRLRVLTVASRMRITFWSPLQSQRRSQTLKRRDRNYSPRLFQASDSREKRCGRLRIRITTRRRRALVRCRSALIACVRKMVCGWHPAD